MWVFSKPEVVEGVDKADVGEFEVFADQLGVGEFDVEVGDVVGKDGDFVAVDFVLVFVPERGLVALEVFDQVADEGAGADGGVENFDVLVLE